ncbi:Crp/Fnr family transcriptional regulator [Beijerinckia sp. L45]|uniref:Crp/Fnr family transcriptional regulator n=1 Tax=Beijerinckia sp. L45 TaxID=1641855 RepID=UPI00131BDB80|nr:Crp/Fnr family transcriptional regulator [Beijerinckia sp. L45]
MQALTALSEDDRVVLAGLSGSPRVIDPGTDLCREADTPDGILIVTAGFACRYKLRQNGARQITDYLLPGDHCDLRALPNEMRGSIVALAPSKVAKISSETLVSVQSDYPAIAEAFRRAALVEGAILREWLMNMGRRSADERLAHLFCELFVRMHTVGLVHGNSFRLPLTQFDLGDTMGLSYVHVNRTLQSLRQQGLFTLSSKTLTILNPEGLQKLAGFDPGYLR